MTIPSVVLLISLSIGIGHGLLLDENKPSNDHDLIGYLDNAVTSLVTQMQKLDFEVQSKNDLTQFLQGDVQSINASLTTEKQNNKAMESKVTQLESRLASAISVNGAQAHQLSATNGLVKSLQNELLATKHSLDIVKYNLKSINTTLSQDTAGLSSNVLSLSRNLSSVQHVNAANNNGSSVAFTFTLPDIHIPTNRSTPLHFNLPVTNEGLAYDKNTGTFTAPHAGIYWFGLTIACAHDGYIACYIANTNTGQFLVEVYANALVTTSASSSVTVRLNVGDVVMVAGCSGKGTIDRLKSSFRGILVIPD